MSPASLIARIAHVLFLSPPPPEEPAEKPSQFYICTVSTDEAYRIGLRNGYRVADVRIVRSWEDVAGHHDVTCLLGQGSSSLLNRNGGNLRHHMRANGWKCVTEL